MEFEINWSKITANDIFTPDLFKWIIIMNKTYDKCRFWIGYGGMTELSAVYDYVSFEFDKERGLGAPVENIFEIGNCEFKRLCQFFASVSK